MNGTKNEGGRAGHARGCERAEELVSFLYGEARPAEAGAFRAHLNDCAVCREELTALGGVRESVALFRAEAEAHARPLDLRRALGAEAASAETRAPARAAQGAPPRQRSALAALREFFRLSPPWLQAGAATAALLFCALAALTLARAEVRWDEKGLAFKTAGGGEAAKAAGEIAPGGYTREQVEALVSERVAGEVAAARGRWEEEAHQLSGTERKQTASANDGVEPRAKSERLVEASSKTGAGRRSAPAGRQTRRPELALEEDDALPRLSDLLGGAYD